MSLVAPLIVIVAYRSDDHLGRCLDGVVPGLDDPARDVLVVDNDDAASTRDLCRRHGVSYLAPGTNLGFAAAVNIGVDRAPGRDVLLLNPDARIDAGGVLALQQALHDDARRLGAVGPTLVDELGRPDASDWPLPSPRQVWADATGLGSRHAGRRFVTGAVLMLRAEAVAEIGGLDEHYFLYAEEADWQLRAQDAGWEVAVVADVRATHVGGASSPDNTLREAHSHRSARIFARRWYGASGAAVMRAGSVAAAVRRAATGPRRDSGRRWVRQQLRPAVATVPARPSVTHVVRSDSFAGVERTVVDVASEQHLRGWLVTVVGGDPELMRRELPPGVTTLPGRTLREVRRSLQRLSASDVLHAHMTAAEGVAVLAKRRLGSRLVVTRHFAAPRGSTPLRRAVGRGLAGSIDVQVAISEHVARSVGTLSTIVHNGVAVSEASPSPDERRDVVLVLQRLEAEKQTEVAVRAWALSGLADRGWRLLIHGRGAEEGTLRVLAEKLGCAASVDFAGYTGDPRARLREAGVLLATTPVEGFGLAVAEAMAEGTPVVAADAGAHREVLGPDGTYFPAGDVRAAAAALVGAVDAGPEERAARGLRLRERQASMFSVQSQVDGLEACYRRRAPRVALVSLDAWDEVWRRNQHLATRLVRDGSVASLLFITPPRGGLALRARRTNPVPGIEVVVPPLLVPRRAGGHAVLGRWLRHATRDVDLLWVNDPAGGVACLRDGVPTVYDVTDDWRSIDQPAADRARVVAAEDSLSTAATTVVCSPRLARSWQERYSAATVLVGNGVDVVALRTAAPVSLPGVGPHVMYVGTAHPSRMDTALLRRLADEVPGTLHLVGPDSLDEAARAHLDRSGSRRHGRVPAEQVPSWLAAADVLVCPHVVDDFTLSLDAIKAYEYLATRAAVVATPSSGFQDLAAPGLTVVDADVFVNAVLAALGTGPFDRPAPADWDERSGAFARVLASAWSAGT